jgi:hypothetical protein
MVLMMKLDNRIIVLALLLFTAFALNYAFSLVGIAENGYAALLGKASSLAKMDVGLLKLLAFLSAFLSSAFLFLGTTGLGKETENEKHEVLPGLFAALLFLFSYFVATNMVFVVSPLEAVALPLAVLGAVLLCAPHFAKYRYAGLIPLAIAAFLASPYINLTLNLTAFSSFPILLAFAFVSVGFFFEGEKKFDWGLLAFVLAVVLAPLFTVLSVAFAGTAAALALNRFFKEGGKMPMLTLVFGLAFFAALSPANVLSAIAIAGSLTVFAYFLFSLYNFEGKNLPLYFSIFGVVLSFTFLLLTQAASPLFAPNADYIAALKYAKDSGLSVALIDLPQTYSFYTGKAPLYQNGTQWIQKNVQPSGYYLFWTKSLPVSFDRYPVAFSYVGMSTDSQGNVVSLLQGGPYILAVPVDSNGKVIHDGELYEAASLQLIKKIPFTKIKLLFGKNLLDQNAVLVSLDGIEDSPLYSVVLKGETVYENTEVKIVKVA